MGLSVDGFEGDFLDLMKKISKRRCSGKGKGVSDSTKFHREMKKLKWTIKDKESNKSGLKENEQGDHS